MPRSAGRQRVSMDVTGRFIIPGVAVEICRFDFAAIRDLPFVDDDHVFGLSLSAQPRNSAGRYTAAAMGRVPSGAVTYKPAGLTLLASNDGGTQTVLRCRISDARFRADAGVPTAWNARALSASLDVTAKEIGHGLRRLAAEMERPGGAGATVVGSVAALLAIDLVRILAPAAPSTRHKGGLTPLQLSRLRDRLADEDRCPPAVAELASLLGLSERHLLRGYRAVAGTCLRHRLHEVTRNRASSWLAESEMPVKEIAARLGYGSQASFATAFGRATGEAPSAFRRRARAARGTFPSEPRKPVPPPA